MVVVDKIQPELTGGDMFRRGYALISPLTWRQENEQKRWHKSCSLNRSNDRRASFSIPDMCLRLLCGSPTLHPSAIFPERYCQISQLSVMSVTV